MIRLIVLDLLGRDQVPLHRRRIESARFRRMDSGMCLQPRGHGVLRGKGELAVTTLSVMFFFILVPALCY